MRTIPGAHLLGTATSGRAAGRPAAGALCGSPKRGSPTAPPLLRSPAPETLGHTPQGRPAPPGGPPRPAPGPRRPGAPSPTPAPTPGARGPGPRALLAESASSSRPAPAGPAPPRAAAASPGPGRLAGALGALSAGGAARGAEPAPKHHVTLLPRWRALRSNPPPVPSAPAPRASQWPPSRGRAGVDVRPGTTSPIVPRGGGGNGLGRRPAGTHSPLPAGASAGSLGRGPQDPLGRTVLAARAGPSRSGRLAGPVRWPAHSHPEPQSSSLWNGATWKVKAECAGRTGSHGPGGRAGAAHCPCGARAAGARTREAWALAARTRGPRAAERYQKRRCPADPTRCSAPAGA